MLYANKQNILPVQFMPRQDISQYLLNVCSRTHALLFQQNEPSHSFYSPHQCPFLAVFLNTVLSHTVPVSCNKCVCNMSSKNREAYGSNSVDFFSACTEHCVRLR